MLSTNRRRLRVSRCDSVKMTTYGTEFSPTLTFRCTEDAHTRFRFFDSFSFEARAKKRMRYFFSCCYCWVAAFKDDGKSIIFFSSTRMAWQKKLYIDWSKFMFLVRAIAATTPPLCEMNSKRKHEKRNKNQRERGRSFQAKSDAYVHIHTLRKFRQEC